MPAFGPWSGRTGPPEDELNAGCNDDSDFGAYQPTHQRSKVLAALEE